jgi:hypothetical protein
MKSLICNSDTATSLEPPAKKQRSQHSTVQDNEPGKIQNLQIIL